MSQPSTNQASIRQHEPLQLRPRRGTHTNIKSQEYREAQKPTEDQYWDAYTVARRNAKARGIEWNLSERQFAYLVNRSLHCCNVTGLPFDMRPYGTCRRRPWAPSLDRKDSSLGYSLLNCRIVCVAANLAMNEWGFEVLARLAEAMNRKPTQGFTYRRKTA